MILNINSIFVFTNHNHYLLNHILEFSRPNRSFKSPTAGIIKAALLSKNSVCNPIVYTNNTSVIFWKTRHTMPLENYFIYKNLLTNIPSYYTIHHWHTIHSSRVLGNFPNKIY